VLLLLLLFIIIINRLLCEMVAAHTYTENPHYIKNTDTNNLKTHETHKGY